MLGPAGECSVRQAGGQCRSERCWNTVYSCPPEFAIVYCLSRLPLHTKIHYNSQTARIPGGTAIPCAIAGWGAHVCGQGYSPYRPRSLCGRHMLLPTVYGHKRVRPGQDSASCRLYVCPWSRRALGDVRLRCAWADRAGLDGGCCSTDLRSLLKQPPPPVLRIIGLRTCLPPMPRNPYDLHIASAATLQSIVRA